MDPVLGPVIGKGLDLASKIFELINTKESRKYIDKTIELKLDLDTELRKPMFDQDDGKIERLRAEIEIIMDVAKHELEAKIENPGK